MGNSKTPSGHRPGRLHSKDPVDAAWRAEQAQVDADIEGLARDPEDDRLIREMDAVGLPIEDQIERLLRHFQSVQARKPAGR